MLLFIKKKRGFPGEKYMHANQAIELSIIQGRIQELLQGGGLNLLCIN